MAAKKVAKKVAKKPVQPRVAPAPLPAPDPSLLDDEEEEDDEEDDEAKFTAAYDTRVFTVVEHGVLRDLVAGGKIVPGMLAEEAKADRARADTYFNGLAGGLESQRGELDRAYQRGDRLSKTVDDLQSKLAMKEREIAEMMRASEEARLETERTLAQVELARASNDNLKTLLEHKSAMHQTNIDAAKELAGPTFSKLAELMVGQVLPGYMQRAGMPVISGLPSGGPPGRTNGHVGPPNGATNGHGQGGAGHGGAPGGWPPYEVNVDLDASDFRDAFIPFLGVCPQAILAHLRAIVFAQRPGIEGAPPLPANTPALIAAAIVEELKRGSKPFEEALSRLVASTNVTIYRVIDPPSGAARPGGHGPATGPAHGPPN